MGLYYFVFFELIVIEKKGRIVRREGSKNIGESGRVRVKVLFRRFVVGLNYGFYK